VNQRDLTPIITDDRDAEEIERKIRALLRMEIYLPIIRELGINSSTLQNSLADLHRAISNGQIRYERGHFKGTFNATLSRELRQLGAWWDRTHGSWKLPPSKLTPDIRSAIAASVERFKKTCERINKRLSDLDLEAVTEKLRIDKIFDRTIYKVNKSFEKSIKGISVAPVFTPEQRVKIRDEYTTNMKLYIKEWAEKEIVDLRHKVEKNVMAGTRYEGLIKTIQKSYAVGQSKAKFLARQETNLLTTKLRETRYMDAGVKQYRWVAVAGSPLHPVRPAHQALADRSKKGELFSWDDPPIVDDKGSRKHPGQDYNCRCIAVPVVRF
jgi:SPP1 gp7 family putative phage head morphogenesis protein